MNTVADAISNPTAARSRRQAPVLPGFGITMGFTVAYLSLLVLLPLAALGLKSASVGPAEFWAVATSPRTVSALGLSFGASAIAAAVNAVFGFIVAWVLVRYEFWGKRIVDAMVDLPFAMPTAVSGIALTTMYAPEGWVGRWLEAAGIQGSYTRLGVVIALVFISVPFVVRTVQPALAEVEAEVEEAAASLGAGRWATFRRVVLPLVLPALMTGFALALARNIGEYGSVVFIAGNRPFETEIAALLIMARLDEHDVGGAAVIATVMLLFSFALLLTINAVQWWSSRRLGLTGGR